MADKFRRTVPIKITFADGEAPTSSKLNSLSNQIRSGMGLIEKAVGDLWNQSGDSVLTDTPIQIPNLARIVGELKYLNPIIFPLKNQFKFRDHIGAKFQGKSEGFLTFPPIGTIVEVNGLTTFTSNPGSEHLVDTLTEYWVDTTTGRFRTGAPLTTEIVEYTVDLNTTTFQHYTQVLPSLVPDPRQDGFSNVRIAQPSPGVFYLILPPRRPLTLIGTDWQSSAIRPERYPGLSDIDADLEQTNEAEVVVGGGVGQAGHTARLYWQKKTASALDDEFYRYSFPKEIQEYLDTTPTPGTELPAGFMYLWNTVTNTIIEDAKFFVADGSYTGKDWVVKVSSDSFDFDTVDTGTEAEASYSSGLVLICPGASITRSLWQLASSFYSHKHDKGTNSDGAVTHRSLKEVNPPKDLSANEHWGRYPTYQQVWGPSRWNADEHNSLLSRVGTQTDLARKRDKFNNAMLGHLLLANADTSGSEDYLNSSLPDSSFKIFFGDITGPYIYGSNADEITVNASSSILTGTLSVGGNTTINGSATIYGNSTVSGHVTPALDNTYDLGSSSFRWRDLYVGPASLNIIALNTDAGSPGTYTGALSLDSTGMKIGHNSPIRKLSLQTNSIDRFIIDENGKTTIGGAAPSSSYMLDIQNSGTTALRLLPTNGTGDAALEVGLGRSGSGYSYIDLIGDSGETDYSTRLLRGNTGVNAVTQFLHKGTGSFDIYAINAAPIVFGTNNTERMRIISTGQVGIGTSSPSTNSLLHVRSAPTGGVAPYGTSQLVLENSSITVLNILSANNNYGCIFFGDSDNASIGQLCYNHTSNRMEFVTSSANRAYIDSAGQLGVGANIVAGALTRTMNTVTMDSAVAERFAVTPGIMVLVPNATTSPPSTGSEGQLVAWRSALGGATSLYFHDGSNFQKLNSSAVAAWGSFSGGTTPALISGYNIASVTWTGTAPAHYTVNFTSAVSTSASFQVTPKYDGVSTANGVQVQVVSSTSINIYFYSSTTLSSVGGWSLHVMGREANY